MNLWWLLVGYVSALLMLTESPWIRKDNVELSAEKAKACHEYISICLSQIYYVLPWESWRHISNIMNSVECDTGRIGEVSTCKQSG